MNGVLTQFLVWLNALANGLGRFVLAPLAVLPGWLSVTLVSAVTGVLLLLVFKYTSHQRAIKGVRSDIKANLLALKLFRESAGVSMRAQGRILLGALQLLVLALVPMLVMALPVTLLLAQLGLWYQARPLHVGEDAVITVKLGGMGSSAWPKVSLEPTDAVETFGPVRVLSKREVCWNVRPRQEGYHRLGFHVDGQAADKELAVGDGFMRVSTQRPGWQWEDVLLNPAEAPFAPDSVVQSIEINYEHDRAGWTSGTNAWVIYWFIVSMVAALCFRPFLNVSV